MYDVCVCVFVSQHIQYYPWPILCSFFILVLMQASVVDYTPYWPTHWLKITRPQVTPYFPQVGDVVSSSALRSPVGDSCFQFNSLAASPSPPGQSAVCAHVTGRLATTLGEQLLVVVVDTPFKGRMTF